MAHQRRFSSATLSSATLFIGDKEIIAEESAGLLAIAVPLIQEVMDRAKYVLSAGYAGLHQGVCQFSIFDAGKISHDDPGVWTGLLDGARQPVALLFRNTEAE